MTKEYLEAVAQLEQAKERVEEERIKMQLDCKHENVAEIPYRGSTYYSNASQPYRICADCGFAEGGWSCGHQILTNEPNRVKAKIVGRIWENRIFIVDIHWQRTGKSPRNKREVYEMVVKGILPKEYEAR